MEYYLQIFIKVYRFGYKLQISCRIENRRGPKFYGWGKRASDFDSRRPPKAISASEGGRRHYMVFKMTAIINLVGTESIFEAF